MTLWQACRLVEALYYLDHDGFSEEFLIRLNEAGDNQYRFQCDIGSYTLSVTSLADGRTYKYTYKDGFMVWLDESGRLAF